MKNYIENIIKTGLANGLTIEQIASDPDQAAKAYLNSQLTAITKSGTNLLNRKQ